jgi:hypothetical protein
VIEVPVGEIKVADLGERAALCRQRPAHPFHASEKAGVDEVDAVFRKDGEVGDAVSL